MNKLIAISIASVSIAIGTIPAVAEVDAKTHKLCLEAKDYLGCVKAMKGETTPTSRAINSQGADMAEGNTCPSMFAYIGGGNCQEVICAASSYGNDERLGGKFWFCKRRPVFGRNSLQFGEKIVRASYSKDCPDGEPGIGFNSTCESNASLHSQQQDPQKLDFTELGDRDRMQDLLDKNNSLNSPSELDANYLQYFDFIKE